MLFSILNDRIHNCVAQNHFNYRRSGIREDTVICDYCRTMRLSRFICMMLSTCKVFSAIYLYDAVYLYLRTVNQTLAEGYPDYRDGRLIRNKTIGQRFVGRFQ